MNQIEKVKSYWKDRPGQFYSVRMAMKYVRSQLMDSTVSRKMRQAVADNPRQWLRSYERSKITGRWYAVYCYIPPKNKRGKK